MPRWDDVKLDLALVGRRAPRVVDFPGAPHVKVAIRLLTEDETDHCKRRAHAVCQESKAFDVLDFYPRVLDREIIASAYLDADTIGDEKPKHFFPDQKFVAELDVGVVTQLAALYTEHARDADPLLYLDADGVREAREALGKELCSRVRLSGFDHDTLVTLCASLASDLLGTSPTPKSPTGSSSEH